MSTYDAGTPASSSPFWRERSRRAVAEHPCPNTTCNAPAGTACANRHAMPLATPHESRQLLVPDWRVKRGTGSGQADQG